MDPIHGQERPGHFIPALDGVRGIAILWVVLHNSSVIDDDPLPGVFGHVLSSGLSAGWAGVTLFFALSGFLITGILLDSPQGKGYFSRFYARRTLRIFPLYYGVLFVAFGLLPLLGPMPERLARDAPHQLWLWSYLSNWSAPFDIADNTFPHFWSLAVEEQFYIFWPLALRHRRAESVFKLCLAVAASALLIRTLMIVWRAPPEMLYTFTVTRMDALALGGAAAAAIRVPGWRLLAERHAGRLMIAALLTLGGCLVALHGLPRLTPMGQTVGYSLLAVGFSLMIAALAGADRGADRSWWTRPWTLAPLRVLAHYSYGMYVFHKIFAETIGKSFMRLQSPTVMNSIPANLAYLATCLLLSLAVAMLSYHLIEKRFLRLKRAFA